MQNNLTSNSVSRNHYLYVGVLVFVDFESQYKYLLQYLKTYRYIDKSYMHVHVLLDHRKSQIEEPTTIFFEEEKGTIFYYDENR